jgi:hypothetical protein
MTDRQPAIGGAVRAVSERHGCRGLQNPVILWRMVECVAGRGGAWRGVAWRGGAGRGGAGVMVHLGSLSKRVQYDMAVGIR